ncbi:hypothetical protein G9U51_12545 [Calidifontibacter sp. DB0510]|uniref:Uncharacterized protein n=1 Tax=Metallococcus carri TaxID=1656884 RepID=A0A967B0N0_9MICO|nr:hypothetical protein [Metallococcus carri]NHN56609.1 hypothetical protein [Metallococcus carri]NOP38908.1 hypothetical protein [Calidifontibacter sp. DB2511S]
MTDAGPDPASVLRGIAESLSAQVRPLERCRATVSGVAAATITHLPADHVDQAARVAAGLDLGLATLTDSVRQVADVLTRYAGDPDPSDADRDDFLMAMDGDYATPQRAPHDGAPRAVRGSVIELPRGD